MINNVSAANATDKTTQDKTAIYRSFQTGNGMKPGCYSLEVVSLYSTVQADGGRGPEGSSPVMQRTNITPLVQRNDGEGWMFQDRSDHSGPAICNVIATVRLMKRSVILSVFRGAVHCPKREYNSICGKIKSTTINKLFPVARIRKWAHVLFAILNTALIDLKTLSLHYPYQYIIYDYLNSNLLLTVRHSRQPLLWMQHRLTWNMRQTAVACFPSVEISNCAIQIKNISFQTMSGEGNAFNFCLSIINSRRSSRGRSFLQIDIICFVISISLIRDTEIHLSCPADCCS